jgi:hypothetical protein
MLNIYDNTLATFIIRNKNGLAFISMFSFKVHISDVLYVHKDLRDSVFVSLKLLSKMRQINVAIDSLSGSYLLLFFCLQFVVFLCPSATSFDKIFIKLFAGSGPILLYSQQLNRRKK